MATRDDVARRAGVSSSTVSYVINGRRTISEATRKRVEEAIRDLNYTPNAFARGLARARGGIIAMHYPSSPQGYSASEFEYVSEASERVRARGYHLLLWTAPLEDLGSLQGLIAQGLVDGMILMEVTFNDPRIEALRAARTPFVTIGRPAEVTGLTFTDNDYDAMVGAAIDHVADLGHRSVLFLGQTVTPADRGYGPLVRIRRALEQPAARRGVHIDVLEVEFSPHGGRAAFESCLARTPRPTAVIGFNEPAMAGMTHAAALAGLPVPEQLTLVALNFGEVAASLTTPPMTTVAPPVGRLTTGAVDSLIGIIEGTATTLTQELVSPMLVVRGTSAPAQLRFAR